MLLSGAGNALVAAGLMGNAWLHRPNLAAVYVLSAVGAGLYGLGRPSVDAMFPRLIPRDLIASAGALYALAGTLGATAGPAAAGGLIAALGTAGTYAVGLG